MRRARIRSCGPACFALAFGFVIGGTLAAAPAAASPPAKGNEASPKPVVGKPVTKAAKVATTPKRSGDQQDIALQARQEAKARSRRQKSKAPTKSGPRTRQAPDTAKLPGMRHPSVHRTRPTSQGKGRAHMGWGGVLAEPSFVDRRRRPWARPSPPPWGGTLNVGERFFFDVTIAGNPAGQVEASVTAIEPDARGPAPGGSPLLRLEGHAVTTGVVTMLSTATADAVSWIDASTGAAVRSELDMTRSGLGASYKRRVIETDYEGRGHVRVIDTKDKKVRKIVRSVPRDTFDDLTVMAWVRSLNLAKGERAVGHVLDGKIMMRVDVVGRGHTAPDPMPTIATALGLDASKLNMLEGTLTRVDRWGGAIEGKRVYNFRAWVSDDGQRIPITLESDMWLGVIRLELNRYDPPKRSGDPR